MMLKVGIVGLRRGEVFFRVFSKHKKAKVVAICDINERRAEEFGRINNIKGVYTDYKDFLKCDMDAVVVCTPLPFHVKNVIAALESGKHVLSEVPAANTLEECEELIKAVKKSKLKYMMAENYIFFAYIQAWKKMIENGWLGKIIYAEAEYVQDCRSIMKEGGKLTWRASMPPIYYCTHSLGPLIYLMEDECVSAVGFNTGVNVAPELGTIDMEVGLFRMKSGAVVKILCGFSIVREPPLIYYSLYGTKGCIENERCGWDREKLYIEDLPNLQDMITLPLSREYSVPPVKSVGYETADYLVANSFIESILNDVEPPVNVYEAIKYTAPGICAHQSAISGGKVIEVPDF